MPIPVPAEPFAGVSCVPFNVALKNVEACAVLTIKMQNIAKVIVEKIVLRLKQSDDLKKLIVINSPLDFIVLSKPASPV